MTNHNTDETERHYYGVELLDTSVKGEPHVMHSQEAEDSLELATVVQSMDNLDMLKPETELRVKKMTRLDAPLTEEEEADLDAWIGELGGAATDGSTEHPPYIPYLEDSVDVSALADETGIPIERLEEYQSGESEPVDADRIAIQRAQGVLPEEGDILHDPESNPRFGNGDVEVVEIPYDTASGYVCRYKGDTPITVADENPGHPSDDPVVLAEYVEGSNKSYAFPISRLQDSA